MTKYECDVCGHKYDEEKEGTLWNELSIKWMCPICDSGKDYFKAIKQDIKIETPKGEIEVEVKEKIGSEYLSE